MDRRALLLGGLVALANGCFVLGGFDFDVRRRSGDAVGGSGGDGTGGGGAQGGGPGTGGAKPCREMPGTECYTGPAWTLGMAACKAGTWACDIDGNATCDGEIAATAEVCDTTRTDENCDTYLLCSGERSWYMRNADTGFQNARRARADAEGNVYVVGEFQGNLTLPTGPVLGSLGEQDLYVAKLDRDGALEWVKAFGSADDTMSSIEQGSDIVPHPTGGVVVVGRIQGVESAGGTGVDPNGGDGLFLARLDASGNVSWAHAYESTASFSNVSVAASPDGEIFVAGGFKGNLALGAVTLQNLTGLDDVFLARFDGSGDDTGARQFGSPMLDYARGVAVADDGRVAIGGLFNDQIGFGSIDLVSEGGNDAFVAVFPPDPFDGAPDPLFAESWGSQGDTADQSATDLAFGPDGSLAFAGYYAGSVDFGGVRMLADAVGTPHACVVRLTAPYSIDLAHCYDYPTKPSIAWGVAVDGVGNIVVSGQYIDNLEMAPSVTFGAHDMFVAKMAPDGAPIWTKFFGGSSEDYEARVGVDVVGNVLVAAKATGAIDFEGNIPGADEDALVVKLLP